MTENTKLSRPATHPVFVSLWLTLLESVERAPFALAYAIGLQALFVSVFAIGVVMPDAGPAQFLLTGDSQMELSRDTAFVMSAVLGIVYGVMAVRVPLCSNEIEDHVMFSIGKLFLIVLSFVPGGLVSAIAYGNLALPVGVVLLFVVIPLQTGAIMLVAVSRKRLW